MKELNLVGLAPNISRAYEIAKFGNHSLKIIIPKDSTLPQADLRLLNDFYSLPYVDGDADMIVELCYSPDDIMNVIFNSDRHENLEIINVRITQSGIDSLTDKSIDEASQSLLKTAIGKLDLSISSVLSILKVAETIARIDNSTRIKIEHVAEAIQYQSFSNN